MAMFLASNHKEPEVVVEANYVAENYESMDNVLAILRSIYAEQNEHTFNKFSEAYIKYRKVVAEWMVDVADYFNLHPTTTHSAIAYLDRLQPNERFSRFEWQMLAICCLSISSKYNECEEHVPSLKSLEEITMQKISNECVLNYELWSLKRMGWKLNARTAVSFLSSYLVVGVVYPDDKQIQTGTKTVSITPASIQSGVFNLATKCILDSRFKGILASATASAILYYIRNSFGIQPIWRRELTFLTGHDLANDANMQHALILIDVMIKESLDSEDKEVASILAAVDAISLTPNSNITTQMTPDQCNKENKKPSVESELSPVSIANFEGM
mmetsp:Transcript_4720/g.6477  ORF Transcript_4720/g.6477 Transcript_4720/m.6477 type:complete len:329 (-) Transcript_4720:566-1552(-)